MKQLLPLILVLALVLPLGASTVLPIDFERLSQSANVVVGGRITSIIAERNPATGYIYSTVSMAVDESVPAGLAGQQYQFRMVGGELDSSRQYIADFPRFQTGDSVVLFLTGETSSIFGPTVGLWQGVFFVEQDKGGRQVITDHQRRPIVGVRNKGLLRASRRLDSSPGSALTTANSVPPLGMAEFMEQVRRHRGR
jgi:hypothetical protein